MNRYSQFLRPINCSVFSRVPLSRLFEFVVYTSLTVNFAFFTGSGADGVCVRGKTAEGRVSDRRHDRIDGDHRGPRGRAEPEQRNGLGAGDQVTGVRDQRARIVAVRAPVRLDLRQLQQLVSGHVPVVDADKERDRQRVPEQSAGRRVPHLEPSCPNPTPLHHRTTTPRRPLSSLSASQSFLQIAPSSVSYHIDKAIRFTMSRT